MASSHKSEETKKSSRKSSKEKKAYEFQTDVQLINKGKVQKGASISRENVKELLKPSRKEYMRKKPNPARFYKNKLKSKEKIALGNKKKRVLEYDQVKMMEQISSDGRKVFVNYENPKNDYFLVLEMKDAKEVKKFMSMVKEANPKTETRWPETTAIELTGEDGVGRSRRSDVETYSADNSHLYSKHSSEPQIDDRPSDYFPSEPSTFHDRPHSTMSTYICADPYRDDGTVYSRGTPDTFSTQSVVPLEHSRGSDNSYDFSNKHDRRRAARLTTQYYYAGPSDEEDSFQPKYRPKSRKSHSNHRHRHYALDDDVSISMASRSLVTEIDYSTPENSRITVIPPARKTPLSRRSSHRSKSRELPLSEAEKSRGGWHSDVMFVTPTKDGGVKVSADGPVMLYTATRANGNRDSDSSDNDSTSDGESDFSYSSGSTLSMESLGRNGLNRDQEPYYINGHR
ncbi:hypothetical protein Aperf_G00000037520 [Anoplocephala perfoliata]